MKGFSYIFSIILGLVIGYYIMRSTPKVTVKHTYDTVKVFYRDTVYKFKTKIKTKILKDTVVYKDSIRIHDTVYVNYYSPFKIGSDTLNCSGVVSFDMQKFSFSNVAFKYPHRVVYYTVTKPDWTYTIISGAAGLIIGVLIK